MENKQTFLLSKDGSEMVVDYFDGKLPRQITPEQLSKLKNIVFPEIEDGEEYRRSVFGLQLITLDDMYYFGNVEEGDENGNCILYRGDGSLASNNYFAENAFFGEMEETIKGIGYKFASEEYLENIELHKEAGTFDFD